MNPLISVLLPTKNRLTYLRYAVESVRRQDYPHWEIVISDNHSEEDILGYAQSLHDPRISCLRTERPLHVTANWNNALDHCRGDFVIMLGDDDGLTRGYFSAMVALLDRHQQPDLIFTNAYVYAYPGVIPGRRHGFLKSDGSPIFRHPEPYLLRPDVAHGLAKQSMHFTMAYPFNMQYSFVARSLIDELKHRGAFYQSPYPDYYCTNALFLSAKRILVDPAPRVIIGVSPKSYGFYHFNNKEDEGASFLDNAPEQVDIERLRRILLPGTKGASAWLLAMEHLQISFPELHLAVDYQRYRQLQIGNLFKRYYLTGDISSDDFNELLVRLTWKERWLAGLPLMAALRLTRLFDPAWRSRILNLVRRLAGHDHAGRLETHDSDDDATTYTNLLEVFEHEGVGHQTQ